MTARYAILTKEFGLTLDQIHALTPRIIETVYFHPRDDKGEVIPPKIAAPARELSEVERITMALNIASNLKLPKEQIDKLKQRLQRAQDGDSTG